MLRAQRLFQVVILFATIACLLAIGWLLTQKDSPFFQPIENYQLTSPVQQLSRAETDRVIGPYLGSSFWDIELDTIQAELVRLDWVLSAQVKRKWPNHLYISIQEQIPVARWNQDGLINGYGHVFFPSDIQGFTNLVRLNGRLDQSQFILQEFIQMQALLERVSLSTSQLSYENGVWLIQVLNGSEIIVDSTESRSKIERFVRALPEMDKTLRSSAQVYDLRYSNGFIVSE